MTGSARKTLREEAVEAMRGRIGDHLRESGKLSPQDIDRIVVAQARGKLRFGETAIELDLLTPEEIQMALSQQYKFPYIEGDDFPWSDDLFSAKTPFGAQSEAIRTLRSDLVLRGFGDEKKIIAVTGGRTGEGASILAANLAISFAQLGERTILIDADLRFPKQHLLFGSASGAGLSSVLSGRSSVTDVVSRMHPFENLSLLCAGAVPPNPQELLSQVAFSYLIETAPAAFDVVIVDTPPILEYADAQIVAKRANGCLCAARRHRTSIADLAQVKMQIERAGAEAIGAIVWD